MRLNPNQITEFVNVVLDSQTEKDFSWIDRGHLITSWFNLMNVGSGVAYGHSDNEVPAGFLLGIHTKDLATGIKKAFEYLWMVSPDKRSGRIALRLLQEFESGAK